MAKTTKAKAEIRYHVEVYDSPECGWIPVDQPADLHESELQEARDYINHSVEHWGEKRSKYRIVKTQIVALGIVK